ncbi:hypothetical protein FRC03_002837, partial [Tulasnella sp. 419]
MANSVSNYPRKLGDLEANHAEVSAPDPPCARPATTHSPRRYTPNLLKDIIDLMPPPVFHFKQPQVASAKRPLNTLHTDLKPQISQLLLSKEQIVAIGNLYDSNEATNILFSLGGDAEKSLLPSQIQARAFLKENHLQLNGIDTLKTRWRKITAQSWGHGNTRQTRALYQCACGYSTHARQDVERTRKEKKVMKVRMQDDAPSSLRTQPTKPDLSGPTPRLWDRHMAYDFTGCLAHADITFCPADHQVLRIMGYFTHNEGCQKAKIERLPPIPLHPQVYEIALQQLQDGFDLYAVKERNRQLFKQKFYIGMKEDPQMRNFRYLILRTDSSCVYHMFFQRQGIDTHEAPEVNIHSWLNPSSRSYKPLLCQSVISYSPRTRKEERFKACVVSEEMEDATWRYAHKSQIILDGTFGLCDRRVLLFIVMGIDKDRHGVPLVFLLFSAPSGNRQMAAGYNTEILKEMLGDWKTWLEKRKGEPFRPSVVITDNDTKERGALLAIFPQIILLLCKFHTRQCWTNQRNSLVVNVSGSNFVKQQTKTRLQILETSLIESTEFGIAVALVEAEELFCETLSQYLETQACGQAALQYLRYLKQYWLFPELWASWSKAGRVRAGEVMNCRIEGVLPTTNHLESFNRILKQDYIKRFQKGGKRLRFDIFLYYLILRIIPSIFDHFQSYEEHLSWIASRFDGQTFQQRSSGSSRISAHPIAWIPKSNDSRGQARDSSRHKKEGEDIAQLNRVHGLKYVDHETLQSRCLSSKTTSFGSNIVEYRLQLHLSGFGWCTCPDFRYHSYWEGACKHLYGLLAHLSRLRQSFPTSYLPIFFFPEDREHAIQLYHQHVSSLPKDWLPSTSLLSAVSTLSDLITIPDIGMVEKLDADEDQGGSNDSSDCMTGVQDTTASGASSPGDKLVQVANEEINEADTTFNSILYASGSQGLEDQLRVQLHHHARLLIPQIYNMNLLVNDTRIGTSDELILELSSLVSQLNSSLQTLLQPLPPNAEGSQCGDLATECLPSENQNDISMLMGSAASASAVPLSMLRAPSPEARQ